MDKFSTIVRICGFGMALVVTGPGPALAGCLDTMGPVQRRALGEQDWVRRETVLAMLTEARRDAIRGAEAACLATLDRARAQLRTPRR